MKHFRQNDGPQQLHAQWKGSQLRPIKGTRWKQQPPTRQRKQKKRPEAGGGVDDGAIDRVQADSP